MRHDDDVAAMLQAWLQRPDLFLARALVIKTLVAASPLASATLQATVQMPASTVLTPGANEPIDLIQHLVALLPKPDGAAITSWLQRYGLPTDACWRLAAGSEAVGQAMHTSGVIETLLAGLNTLFETLPPLRERLTEPALTRLALQPDREIARFIADVAAAVNRTLAAKDRRVIHREIRAVLNPHPLIATPIAFVPGLTPVEVVAEVLHDAMRRARALAAGFPELSPRDCAWFVQYNCLGISAGAIARADGVSRQAIMAGVRRAAAFLDIPLRAPGQPGRPRKPRARVIRNPRK